MGFEDKDSNSLIATELRLGLPGTEQSSEQESSSSSSTSSSPCVKNGNNKRSCEQMDGAAKAPKAQVIGWPPVRSYRKNTISKSSEPEVSGTLVKVSMDGAPYLRKIDLCGYTAYCDLLQALEGKFKCSMGEYSERLG